MRKNIKGVLNDQEVVRICLDQEFDSERIRHYLKGYETDAKYRGLEQFEWSTATSRKDKEQRRKDDALEQARQAEYREQQRRRWEIRQANIERRAENQAKRAEEAQARKDRKEALIKEREEKQ